MEKKGRRERTPDSAVDFSDASPYNKLSDYVLYANTFISRLETRTFIRGTDEASRLQAGRWKRIIQPVDITFRKDLIMKHIVTLDTRDMAKSAANGGCGECQTSCQSACKTSCGVANQPCENKEAE